MKKILVIIIVTSFSSIVLASKSEMTYQIKWKEDSGKIVHRSVCYNYKSGSIDFRRCRSEAKKYFKAQCKYYKSTPKDSKDSKDSKDNRLKFCRAASLFNPIVS